MNLLLLLLLSLLASACTIQSEGEPVFAATLSPAKQRHRLAHLQKKLEWAEKELEKSQQRVEVLHQEIGEVKLLLIRRQIDQYEERLRAERHEKALLLQQEEASSLFIEQRGALLKIIEEGPPLAAMEAQRELDRILRVITERGR